MNVEAKKERLSLLIEKLRRDMNLTEDEEDVIIQEMEALSPDPDILDYIFGKEYEGLTTDEIIEKAFSYKPICL